VALRQRHYLLLLVFTCHSESSNRLLNVQMCFCVLNKNICAFSPVPTSEIDLSSPLNYGTPSSRGPHTPGMGETPIRHRPDIHSEKKMRTVNIGGSEPSVCFSFVHINYKILASCIEIRLKYIPLTNRYLCPISPYH